MIVRGIETFRQSLGIESQNVDAPLEYPLVNFMQSRSARGEYEALEVIHSRAADDDTLDLTFSSKTGVLLVEIVFSVTELLWALELYRQSGRSFSAPWIEYLLANL